MRKRSGRWGALSLSVVMTASCTAILGIDEDYYQAGAGGAGGAVLCAIANDCPGADDDCKKRSCVGGFCGFDFAAEDTVASAQAAGDCLRVVCDGQGNLQAVPDTNDPPDDSRECTIDACNNSIPNVEQKPTGTQCTEGGGAKCNDAGACVECLAGTDCQSGVCDTSTFKCAPAACGDAAKNGSETDVDCGGGECPACGPGKGCNVDSDCIGQDCAATCQPSCKDKVLNNGETDTDCGGANCGKCAISQTCKVASDCASNNCVSGTCFIDHLVINEIDYDQPNPSTTVADPAEFVEIYNGTGVAKSLSGLALVFVNGTDGTTYLSVDLGPAGTLAPGQYLVYASNAVDVPSTALKIAFIPGPIGTLQNGAPDGVALVDTKAAKLLDALSYEGPLTMASVMGLPVPVTLVEGTALPASTADSNADLLSLIRLPDGLDTNNAASDWKLSSTPTPGAANKP